MIVMKFGGTSVGDAATINRLTEIVKSRIVKQPVVVVSAISKATDTLKKSALLSEIGESDKAEKLIKELEDRHFKICTELLDKDSLHFKNVYDKIKDYFTDITELLKGVSLLSELSDRSLAKIITHGELLSSAIVDAVLNHSNITTKLIDAREFIFTDNNYLVGEPLTDKINSETPKAINILFKENKVVLTQGFISNTVDKITTTLGRGGSDYSAALIGMALNAEEIEIWTDVDGMLTADPRKVNNTKIIPVISFEEAAELAYFGAKVLHPLTIQPAIEKDIPVRILNSKTPEKAGTLILSDSKIIKGGIKSISCKENIKVLNIFSTKMLNSYGFLRRIFEIFDNNKTSVDLITTSEVNVSLTLDNEEHVTDIVKELSVFSRVNVEVDKSLICVVGKNIKNTKGIAKRIFNRLDDYNINMISQGASEINISFVVNKSDLQEVMQILHEEFFETA
ncbi:MAG: lysine-sensitive aspartokinase 3 [Candidatus Kapaibacterium sp.]